MYIYIYIYKHINTHISILCDIRYRPFLDRQGICGPTGPLGISAGSRGTSDPGVSDPGTRCRWCWMRGSWP